MVGEVEDGREEEMENGVIEETGREGPVALDEGGGQ